MKTKLISTLLMTLCLSAVSATIAAAQTIPAAGMPPATTPTKSEATTAPMMMASEPNQVMAAAYHQNLMVFADALHGQTSGASAVNVEFARAAVTEMRRGFDQMRKYHDEYMKTISAEVRTNTTKMMQTLETQRADLNTQLLALEKEVGLTIPDAKKITTMTAGIHTQLDAMSQLNQSSQSTKMTMKD